MISLLVVWHWSADPAGLGPAGARAQDEAPHGEDPERALGIAMTEAYGRA